MLVPKGIRIRLVVTTRWSEFDLFDYLRQNEDYRMFNVPALDAEGNSNFTSFYPKEKLNEIQSQIGQYMFSCLYLNAPLDPSLRVFQDSWFNWVGQDTIPWEDSQIFNTIAIDPAISEKDEACETAITKVMHVKRGTRWHQYWVRDIHGHLNPNETANKALDLCDEKTKAILIETNAYQAALKYVIRDEMISRGLQFSVISIPSRTKKTERIYALEPFFANGYIHLVKGLTNQVESQLKQFPNGRLVDIIDCFAMHMKVYRGLKITQAPVEKKPVDPFSFDVVMEELRSRNRDANSDLRSSLTVCEWDENYCALTTGLT
jgi:predicted phage terminase large subunit-like protein